MCQVKSCTKQITEEIKLQTTTQYIATFKKAAKSQVKEYLMYSQNLFCNLI